MTMTPADRKAELVRLGKTQQVIAEATGAHFSLVSHVIAGRRLTSPGAQTIIAYVAGVLGVPVEDAFPERTAAAAT